MLLFYLMEAEFYGVCLSMTRWGIKYIGKGFLLLCSLLSHVALINIYQSRDSSLHFPRPTDDLNQNSRDAFCICSV